MGWMLAALVIGVAAVVLETQAHTTTTTAPPPTTRGTTSTTTLPPHTKHCGYQSCPVPKENYLNIHLVPHTHDDVGWLKTYDQYYYGNLMNIQDAGVQYILDSVVQELIHDEKKRFIYVETAYFWKWWGEQGDSLRHQVKKLVDNGRLEFVGGAWSMHDEACTHYQSMIDQTTWGFKRLSDTFGKCGRPRAGWQIDPFGHSRENARQMAQFGFDGLFLGRIDYQDKEWRVKNKTMEMVWHTSANDKSDASKLFTSVLYNRYSAPPGFCFDVNCHDEPIVENRKSPMYNAPKRAAEFAEIMSNYSKAYKTDNILVTMGDDFMYMDAHMYFKNMDKLIHHVNKVKVEGRPLNVFYSTPTCYLKAVHDTGVALPSKTDDFMPYASDPTAFWSGYFTSRPTGKYFERLGNNFLQVCKQLHSLSSIGNIMLPHLTEMREAMGVMQHHDAVTGTEKTHVASDYYRILSSGIHKCLESSNMALSDLMNKGATPLNATICLQSNITSCKFAEKQSRFVVTVYNPLSRPVDKLVRLPAEHDLLSYNITAPDGSEVAWQVMKLPEAILQVPGRKGKAKAELVFMASAVPPLGFSSYYITKLKMLSMTTKKVETLPTQLGFKQGVSIKLSESGEISHMRVNGEDIPVKQSFLYYRGAVGNNGSPANRSSGAYILRPNGTAVELARKPVSVSVYKGEVVKEVHLVYSDWASQVIRLHQGSKYVEFQWLVGPIPISDGVGKEVIIRYATEELHTNGEFWTDSNGREYIKRKLNQRPTWPVRLEEKVPGNYYPVGTTISVTDGKKRFSVVTDRAEGGTSLADGEIELMVHRRLLHDDAFGVGEALNETAFGKGLVVLGSHYLTLENLPGVRKLVQERILDSWVFISPAESYTYDTWKKSFLMQFSALSDDGVLPENVQILTLEPWSGNSLLLRLEHIMEASDDPLLSQPAKVNLKALFKGWNVTSVEELTLGANQKLQDSKRLVWNEEASEPAQKKTGHRGSNDGTMEIVLEPMQIRTFSIEIQTAV